MVNNEILEGLKLAVSRGEPLKYAMNTFYNAGYKKQEVEEAAKILNNNLPSINQFQKTIKKDVSGEGEQKQTPNFNSEVKQKEETLKPISQNSEKQTNSDSKQENLSQQEQPPKRPGISDYTDTTKQKSLKRKRIMIIILIIILCFLLAAIAGLFIFKEAIINYLMEPI